MLIERDNRVLDLENKFQTEINDKNTKINDLQKEIQCCRSINSDLSSQLKKINHAHDELDAYGRRECLVFSGDKIKVHQPDENIVDIAKNIINNDLKCAIDPLISTAHRMGKPPASGSNLPDKRPIIVKFVKRDDKFLILRKATNKTTRVPGLFVNESLTPLRSKILNVLRQCKKFKNGLVKGTTTINGRVFAVHKASATSPDDAPMMKTEINTKEMLHHFCGNFLKQPLESFLDAESRKFFM